MITDQDLQAAKTGDIATLVELDRRGLLLGAHESTSEYAERLACLRRNIAAMEVSLEDTGETVVEDLRLKKEHRIPGEQFEEVRELTTNMYDFSIDWVPGFYLNPRMGWLFGGCAFYFFPDFFAVFILRQAFRKRQRWLIYDRTELLAHELCHVARIALHSRRFEEFFAYQTSQSRFRKIIGGMFRSPVESLLLLGSTFLLLGAQIVALFAWPGLPIWPFWGILLTVVLALIVPAARDQQRLKAAANNLRAAGYSLPRAILFRCTDAEIKELAGITNSEGTDRLLSKWIEESPRWRVIQERFPAMNDMA